MLQRENSPTTLGDKSSCSLFDSGQKLYRATFAGATVTGSLHAQCTFSHENVKQYFVRSCRLRIAPFSFEPTIDNRFLRPKSARSVLPDQGVGVSMAWSRVLSFTDPFPYQAAIRAADVELYPTTKGEFHAELTQINLNQLWMQRFHERLPQIYVGKVRPGRRIIGFLTDEDQPTLLHCGRDVSPHDIVFSDDDVMHHRTEGDCRYGGMSMTNDDFDAACKAIVGHEFPVDKLKRFVRPNPDLMSRLTRIHGTVGLIAKTSPPLLELPEVSRALEQQLVHLMVRCLTEGASAKMTTGGLRHNAIIARFEAFLEANPNKPLYLAEICAAIGATERTLRNACEEYLGIGPIRYLGLRRMHLVRRALLRAVYSTTTVTRVATDHGFWELGRFSVTYRIMFGETPSETLQRLADGRRKILDRPTSLANSEIA